MTNKTQTKKAVKKQATINKMLSEKKAIHDAIKNGDNLSDLSAKGIRFVKPL